MNSSTENSNNIAETLKTHCPKINLKALQKNRVCHECSGSITVQYMFGTNTEHICTVAYSTHSIWDKLSF